MPERVVAAGKGIDTALARLTQAVGQLEEAADRAASRALAEGDDRGSELPQHDGDAERRTEAIAAVLARLGDTVARLRAVVGEDAVV